MRDEIEDKYIYTYNYTYPQTCVSKVLRKVESLNISRKELIEETIKDSGQEVWTRIELD